MHPLRFPNSGIRAKVAGHDQTPYRGGRPWLGYLQVAVARRGNSSQGAVVRRGNSPQRAATPGHGQLRPARKGCLSRSALPP
ncbi:hypothetical protein B296_00032051, partial [Ensete ventricosum]